MLFGTRSWRVLSWNCSDSSSKCSQAYARVLLLKKNSDIARFGFFLTWVLEVVCLEEIFLVTCAFFKEKSALTECSPRASCYLEQGARGSCLEIALILRRRAPEHILGLFIKKNSDIARSGFFLLWGLEVICLEEVFLVTCAFFKEKSALTECSPRASYYLEQGAGGSWILCCLKTAVLK